MSIDASRWAWIQQITPSQKIVLLSLADRADEEGYCYPSVKRLELDCSMTRRTIQRNLSELEALNLIERKSRFTESGQTSNDFFLIGVDYRHGENTPKISRSGRRKPIKSMDSNRAISDTPPAPLVTPPRAISDTPPAPSVTPRTNKQQSVKQKTNNNAHDQTAAPTIALNGLTERQKEEVGEKLAQLSPEQQSIAIQSFNKTVLDGKVKSTPMALISGLIDIGLKNELGHSKIIQPIQTHNSTPKTPAISDKDYRSSRIEVIKALISDPKRKEHFLNEFNEKGHVFHNAAGGAIMKPDLEAAGLFC